MLYIYGRILSLRGQGSMVLFYVALKAYSLFVEEAAAAALAHAQARL